MDRTPAFRASPTNPGIEEIQTIPARGPEMPYAPAIRVRGQGDMLFVSGSTPATLYHAHPHVFEEHNHPNDIRAQTRLAMDNIAGILTHEGLTWTDVVKITKYLTDMRDFDGMVAAMSDYLHDWKPASTTICVNQLSTPGARVEIDVIAIYPV